MRFNKVCAALVALLPIATATLRRRIINDPEGEYLNSMCLPNHTDRSSVVLFNLVDSPFPCEQGLYIEAVCTANGTQEVDFLAEQECLCNGQYFYAEEGCNNCFYQHGYHKVSQEDSASSLSSLSAAECTPSPAYQPFRNLIPLIDATSARNEPPITLTDDKAPNNTAVSVYWTEKRSVTPGEITGSATGRQLTWTNTHGVTFTPTFTPTGTTSYSNVLDSTSSSSSGSGSGSGSASGSLGGAGNIAVRDQVDILGCLVAAAFGAIALL